MTGSGSEWDNTSTLTVTGSGRTLTAASGGFVDVGSTLSIQNAARAYTTGGGRIEAGSLTVQSSGGLFSTNGYVGTTSTASGSASSLGNAAVTGSGSLWSSDSLAVNNNRVLSVADNATVYVASNINVTGGSSTLNIAAATVNADVTIANAILTGTGADIGPGNSPGLLSVIGDYTQDANSTLRIELGGLTAATEYDVLAISGTASLAGTLDVDLFDPGSGLFTPSLGDSFDILTADSLYGSFDNLLFASLTGGLDWDIDYLIDAFGSTDVVSLSVVSTVPVPGAVWLFGSGLMGLVGVARRKKAA